MQKIVEVRKQKPLESSHEEQEQFDNMFWKAVDPGWHPEDISSPVDSVPKSTIERSTTCDSPEDNPMDESPLERLVRERKEKLNA